MSSTNDYKPGHPWFYRLGGRIQYPSEIYACIIASGSQGYNGPEIRKIDQMHEPIRSERLRALHQEYKTKLFASLYKYRNYWRTIKPLSLEEKMKREIEIYTDPFTGMSLIYNHMSNYLAHLHLLNELLSKQGDLFD